MIALDPRRPATVYAGVDDGHPPADSDSVEAAAGSCGGIARWRLCLYALGFASFLAAVVPAAAAVPHGSVVGWGCAGGGYGQCRIPASARRGVIAIAVAVASSLGAVGPAGSLTTGNVAFPPRPEAM